MGLIDDIWDVTKDTLGKSAKKTLSTVNSLSKADPRVLDLVDRRLADQDKWNDVFSTKLIELLDKGDVVRAEIRKNLAQIVAASRAQADLTGAAEEHRVLSATYKRTNEALALAQDRFERAEGILTDADELKQRATAYTAAEGQVIDARRNLDRSTALLSDAEGKLLRAEHAIENTLRNTERFAVRAEAAAKESDLKFTEAQERYRTANAALDDSVGAFNRASSMNAEALQAARSASSAQTDAVYRLGAAETTLRDAWKQATQAANNQTTAAADLLRAQVLMSASELRLEQATSERQEAAVALREAERQVRQSAAYAAVSLVAAISICVWGAVHSIHLGQYGALAPSALTCIALCFGIHIWRRVR